jgi:hypothetical protein
MSKKSFFGLTKEMLKERRAEEKNENSQHPFAPNKT